MKNPFAAAMPLVLAFACFGRVAAGGEGDPVLNVYTWDRYFDPGVIEAFEDRNRCRVDFTYYDSNETMFALLDEGGGYDVITPPGDITRILFERGIIRELDPALLPNLKNLDPESLTPQRHEYESYCIPYTESVTGIGYNRTLVTAAEAATWNLFDDVRYAGRTAMLNDMREIFAAALRHLGFSLNTINPREIKEAAGILGRWKRNIAIFSVDEAKAGLISGKYAAIQAYNGDILDAAMKNPDIDFSIPAEGSSISSDVFVIGADTRVPELAHAFINHMFDAEMAAQNMAATYFYMPNSAAYKLLPENLRAHPAFLVGKKNPDTCEIIATVGDKLELYDAAWEEVLMGQ